MNKLTKREYIAVILLQGILTNGVEDAGEWAGLVKDGDALAVERAVDATDALLEALQ